ncbi:hypothetical protein NECAME_04806 [Necator americanus]|uniref:Uncharacterized protein n=1 Tax=Necator americanus TaxID=51031 RepID=W2SMR8_NECAM|nr:hypothetical protein NECAME_04806 [Necator americanus]ETN70793.1 hypothetical protein NECAME_04806 [Necator americanus]
MLKSSKGNVFGEGGTENHLQLLRVLPFLQLTAPIFLDINRDLDITKRPENIKKDMESLRYEISWKDERIEYLQKTLAEMEDSLPSSSADPYPP